MHHATISGMFSFTQPMHEMSFWELVKNSPEWVSALATVVFGLVSAGIILWQVLLMRKQGNTAARLLAQQNLLIRWQHEHEWIYERNRVRQELRDLTQRISLAAYGLKGECGSTDSKNWERLFDVAHELSLRLSALDLAVYSTPYDTWYEPLDAYVEGVLMVVGKNAEFTQKHGTDASEPTLSVLKEIEELTKAANPIKIQLDIENSIRMDFLDFKQKWDQGFPFDS